MQGVSYCLAYFSASSLWGWDWDFGWFRAWTRLGAFSALESLVRNAVHVGFVLRLMNVLDAQDSFWVCNALIWSWMLLPALPLADLLR